LHQPGDAWIGKHVTIGELRQATRLDRWPVTITVRDYADGIIPSDAGSRR
jgi:hypothetical protein